jgi:hypothetical protein
MAKKLIQSYYTFNSATDTIVVEDYVKHEELLLITDVSTGVIIYNFADPTKGATAVTFDEETEETTIELAFDTSGAGSTDDSVLQIIVDEPNQKMDIHESFVDPVHKFRVSTPQNLIDTDFEYGLQPTKWETVELSQNVPSYYVADGDAAIASVTSITAVSGSNLITVTCSSPHGLVVGTPVDVQGLTSRSAEGKFLVKSVSPLTFSYQANANQTTTGEIGSAYTAVTPGQFYSGSQITYDRDTGFSSDEAANSTLTISTANPHGFVQGSNFYLTNTIAKKTLSLSNPANTAGDGRDIVDPDETVAFDLTSYDQSLTETKQYIPMHSTKFNASSVNTTNNTITWSNHGLKTNDCILYIPPNGDTQIGGLNRFYPYYVKVVDTNTLQLTTSYNGTAINFSSAGTYNYGRACIGVVYEILQGRKAARNSYSYAETRANQTGGVGSGWDLSTYFGSGYGLGNASAWPNQSGIAMVFSTNGTDLTGYQNLKYYGSAYSTADSSLYAMNESGTTPSAYNFVEDGSIWSTSSYYNGSFYGGTIRTDRTIQFYSYGYSTNYNLGFTDNYSSGACFWVPLKKDEEGDTFYAEGHGIAPGSQMTLGVNSGSNLGIQYSTTSRTSYGNNTVGTAEVVSEDRFRFIAPVGSSRIYSATGDYAFTGSKSNPTKNSFYLPGHGLATGTELLFDASGGTVPSSRSGTVQSEPGETNKFSFNVIDSAVDTYMTGLSGRVNISTSTQTDGYRITDSSGMNLSFTSLAYYSGQYYNTDLNQYQNVTVYVDDVNSSTPYYPWQNTVYTSDKFKPAIMGTDWTPNTSIPYWMAIYETDDAGGSYSRLSHNFTAYIGGSGAGRTPYTYSTTTNGNWYHTGSMVRITGSSANDMIIAMIKIRDRGRFNTTSGMNAYAYTASSIRTYVYSNNYTHEADKLIYLQFAVDDSTQFSSTQLQQLGNSITSAMASNFVYPTLTNGQTYIANAVTTDRISLKNANDFEVDILNNGAGTLSFETTSAEIGAIDGAYTASSVTENNINISTTFTVNPIDYEFDAATVSADTINIASGHKLQNGAQITYNSNGQTSIGGLTNGDSYYVIVVDDEYIQLAANLDDFNSGTAIALTAGSFTHKIESQTISGVSEAAGTVQTSADSDTITGSQTLFKRYFKPGDTVYIKDDSTTPGTLSSFTVVAIADDEIMQVDRSVGFTAPATKYFVESAIYARPDGYAVHRPFDGGVEIAAGTAPYSQITRQTRKYFRYQSGKGIQTSLAINFSPPVIVNTLTASGTTATCRTQYPHRLTDGLSVTFSGASDDAYNDSFVVTVVDPNTFTFTLGSTPTTSIPGGIIQYVVDSYEDAATRAGMFDPQNGFFFEYDGQTLKACRRSSTTQLSGRVQVVKNSNRILGTDSNFSTQLNVNDYVVIRGMSYKVIKINSRNEMFVQPEYRGVSASNIILTKTEDVKVSQSEWNIDHADGTGPEGFNLDIHKIQMAYMDYSWYGAGKIRFGFKDREGHVRYVHEFVHNNRLDEAYMRSGNIPAKYEVVNGPNPTYAPTLFHWGTSVIMDGRFDEDEAYLFTAQSNTLSFTNGDAVTATTTGASSLYRGDYDRQQRRFRWYVRIPFATSDSAKFPSGTPLYTATGGTLNGEEVAYTQFSGSTLYVYIDIGYGTGNFGTTAPAVYPSVDSAVVVNIGEPASGGDSLNLGTATIPLVTLRLAPSVDGGIAGNLGERDIINRMQLKLQEVGLILTHDSEVKLILNGDLSRVAWEGVQQPSLSQLLRHNTGDEITGGSEIFSFRASGGSTDSSGKRLGASTNFSLASVIDMGNSILGGDGTFPNGPDILTVAIQVTDTSGISASSPFAASARITWAESQA